MVSAWLKNSRTEYMKLAKKVSERKKSGAAPMAMTALQKWKLDTFSFLKEHKRIKQETVQMGIPGSSEAIMTSDLDSDDSNGSEHSHMSSTSSLTRASSQISLAAEAQTDTRPGASRDAKVFMPPRMPLAKPRNKRRLRESKEEAADSKSSIDFLSKVLHDNTQTMSATLSDLKDDNTGVRSSFMSYLRNEVQELTEPQWNKFKAQCNSMIYKFSEERQLNTSGVTTFQYQAQTTPHNYPTTQMGYSFVGDILSAPAPAPSQLQYRRPQFQQMNNPPTPQRHAYIPPISLPELSLNNAGPSFGGMATPVRGMSLPNSNLNTPQLPRLTTATATASTTAISDALGALVGETIGPIDAEGNASDTTVDVENSAHNSDEA